MAQQNLNYGTIAGDGTGEVLFTTFQKSQNNFNELYAFQEDTGFQSRSDIITSPSLTLATDNVMIIAGTSEGNLTDVLDSNSKITPTKANGIVTIDFACTFITPAGSNNSVDIKLKVGAYIYRGFTYPLTKGSGFDDMFSVSWSLPIGSYLLANGAEIIINPTSTLSYKERYITAIQK